MFRLGGRWAPGGLILRELAQVGPGGRGGEPQGSGNSGYSIGIQLRREGQGLENGRKPHKGWSGPKRVNSYKNSGGG